jgi:hypothetical protein
VYCNAATVNIAPFDVQFDFDLIEWMPSPEEDHEEEGSVTSLRRTTVASLVMSKEHFKAFAELVISVQDKVLDVPRSDAAIDEHRSGE